MWFVNLSYPHAQEFARWLTTLRLNRFSPQVFTWCQRFGWIFGIIFLAAGIYQLVSPYRTRLWIHEITHWFKYQAHRLAHDTVRMWQNFYLSCKSKGYLAAVLGVIIAAIFVRILFLSMPMGHDEAYTVVVFSWRPWLGVISDYHLPNNHIFHSILVKLSSSMLGTTPWAVRFPAFLAGILCVPAGYLVARQMYNRISALLSAGLIAALPMFIDYSANARGYSLYTLFALILFGLAIYLSKHKNLSGWILFVFFSILGFYTVPFMLYPFGAACFWLLASAVVRETQPAYSSVTNLVKYLVIAGMVTGITVVVLYSPILIFGTGLNSLLGNSFVARLSWAEFWPTFGERIRSTWVEWNYDVPVMVQMVLGGGTLLSVIIHSKISRLKVPAQITTLVWLLGILVIQRPDPLARLWTFLIPFWLIWAGGGLVVPLTKLRLPWNKAGLGLVVVSLVLMSGWSIVRVHTYFPQWKSAPGATELAAEYLKQNLVPGDAVAVVSPDDAPLWFYLKRAQVPETYFYHIDQAQHNQVFAVVNPYYGESPETVLQIQGLSSQEYPVESFRLAKKFDGLEIYSCLAR